MKTIIVEEIKTQAEPDSFPRLWRNRISGNVYLETEGGSAIISSAKQNELALFPGDHCFPTHAYERITSPITIRFEP